MSKKIHIKDQWELNTFMAQMIQAGIVAVEGQSIMTVHLVDRTKVIFHCTLGMILIQNENGHTIFDFTITYNPRIQQYIWEALPNLRRVEKPKFMALIASKYGESDELA